MGSRFSKKSPYSKKFKIMLETLSHPDGGRWTGTKMERATGKKVSTSYFSALRDDHIDIPRADKVEAIAEAMGFPPGLWFRSLSWWEEARENWVKGRDLRAVLEEEGREANVSHLSLLLERLIKEHEKKTGELLTDEAIAKKSGGVLRKEDVGALRSGRLADPTWAQVLSLCDVFNVDASYWLMGDSLSWRPSPAVLEAVEGSDSYVIFQNSLKLSERDRTMLKMIAEHMRREQEGTDSRG